MNLISGWLPIGVNSAGEKKPFGEWAGKLCWVAGIVVAILFIDKIFNKPPVTNVAAGGTQIIYQDQRDMMGVGCNFLRAYAKIGIKSK